MLWWQRLQQWMQWHSLLQHQDVVVVQDSGVSLYASRDFCNGRKVGTARKKRTRQQASGLTFAGISDDGRSTSLKPKNNAKAENIDHRLYKVSVLLFQGWSLKHRSTKIRRIRKEHYNGDEKRDSKNMIDVLFNKQSTMTEGIKAIRSFR